MQHLPQELSDTYRNYSDAEIASLYAEMESLTDNARSTLSAEIQRRGMSTAQLAKMHAFELRREDIFDQREKIRRERLAFGRLGDNPREVIVSILLFLVAVLIAALFASHH
jgi:hypothetical protein